MQLAPRKEKILASVIETYIRTGEPVGSKLLQTDFGINASSATIRNELAELTSYGLLIQPHTSAGRVPTDRGYRYYIDKLMVDKSLSQVAKEHIYQRMLKDVTSPEGILKTATELISEITHSVAIATTPDGKRARVHRINFVPVGRYTAMVVLITSTGMVKTSLFRCDFVITPELLAVFDKALNRELVGCPLTEITPPFMQTLAASFGELTLFIPNVLLAISNIVKEATVSTVEIAGKMNILSLPEISVESGKGILNFLNSNKAISLISEQSRDLRVLIGLESGIGELADMSMLISQYDIAGQKAGVIATLCHKRVDYSSRLAIIEYIAQISSKLMNELVAND